jgi:hypothetical protein
MHSIRYAKAIAAVIALAVVLGALPAAWAQDATGRIIGVATDPTGAVIPGVKVTVINADTKFTKDTVTGADGSYQVLLLPIGMYQVTAEAQGFRKVITQPAKLEINQSLRVDLKMELGAVTDTVEVEANATRVETVNATLGQSVTGNYIRNMPLNGRNVMDLALLTPGVIPNPTSTTYTFSVAGGRGDSVTYLLDGGNNNNLLSNAVVFNPNPDAIEEFKILTNNYTAEYGRNAGGVVSVVTRSGANTAHGSAYDYVRNEAFNANSFFNNAYSLPKAIYKRNQFGGTFGGPVLIPKVVNGRDRLFFFVAYQSQRRSELQASSRIQVYTPAELNGDFSHSGPGGTPDQKVVKYLVDHPYFQPSPTLASQGIIDPSRINTISKNYIKAGIIPSDPSGFLISQGAATTNYDELTEKLDFLVTPKDRLTATLGERRAPTLTPFADGYSNVVGFPNLRKARSYFGNVDYTKTVTSTLINDFRVTAQRNNSLQAVPGKKLPGAQALGIGITPDADVGPPFLSFTSMSLGFSYQGPSTLVDNTFNWADTVTWMKGSHTFKGGVAISPYQDNQIFDFYVSGAFYFYGSAGLFSQNDRADFLMGLPDRMYQAPAAPSNIRTTGFSGFFQDEWKVRRNLVLTLGMRYEYSTPKTDTQGRMFSLNYGHQSSVFPGAPAGLMFPGDKDAPSGSNYSIGNNWAPRFGFAFDPRGNGKTSIRGGIGLFYDILKAEDNFQFNGQPPYAAAADLYFDALSANPTGEMNYFSQPFKATGRPNPFPTGPVDHNMDFYKKGLTPFGGSGVYFVDPHIRTPYIYQYNLSVQRELMRETVLEVSYMGSNSHKLTGLMDVSPMILGTKNRIFNVQPGLDPKNPAFSYLLEFSNVGTAYYDSLVVGLNRRMTELGAIGKLDLHLNYTLSKSIDTESGFRATTNRVAYYNQKVLRAVSDFDTPQYLNLSANWQLPFYKMAGPKRLTGGWYLYPILSYRSGSPLRVSSGYSTSPTRVGPSGAGDSSLVKANLVGPIGYFDPHVAQSQAAPGLAANGKVGNYYFTPSSFAQVPSDTVVDYVNNPALRTYGSLGRNAFRGPDRVNLDVSVVKEVPVYRERLNAQIRADFFNIMNHAEFSNPSTTLTSGTFGQISATADPRIIQLALRLQF